MADLPKGVDNMSQYITFKIIGHKKGDVFSLKLDGSATFDPKHFTTKKAIKSELMKEALKKFNHKYKESEIKIIVYSYEKN
jgi:hypothetical protein